MKCFRKPLLQNYNIIKSKIANRSGYSQNIITVNIYNSIFQLKYMKKSNKNMRINHHLRIRNIILMLLDSSFNKNYALIYFGNNWSKKLVSKSLVFPSIYENLIPKSSTNNFFQMISFLIR